MNERVLDKDTSLAESIFHKQDITIIAIITALSMTMSKIALAMAGIFGGEGCTVASEFSPIKRLRRFEKMAKQATRCT